MNELKPYGGIPWLKPVPGGVELVGPMPVAAVDPLSSDYIKEAAKLREAINRSLYGSAQPTIKRTQCRCDCGDCQDVYN